MSLDAAVRALLRAMPSGHLEGLPPAARLLLCSTMLQLRESGGCGIF